MGKRQFTDIERHAVYFTHGEKCYMCRKPLDLMTMEVDHVIPESLLEKPERLKEVVVSLGLPVDFDVQSYANWLPSCSPCNKRKRSRVFDTSGLIQIELQMAKEKAPKAKEMAAKQISNRKLANAWNTIKCASLTDDLGELVRNEIVSFAEMVAPNREPEAVKSPLLLAPLLRVIDESKGFRVVQGPYGIGTESIGENLPNGLRCPTCGATASNGARCIFCGQMDDD